MLYEVITPSAALLSDNLNCRESALCARLFTPIAAVFKSAFTVTGSGSLLNRPVAENFNVLKQMGCVYESAENKLPVKFSRTNIQSGQYYVDGSKSSQFVITSYSIHYTKLYDYLLRLFLLEWQSNRYALQF